MASADAPLSAFQNTYYQDPSAPDLPPQRTTATKGPVAYDDLDSLYDYDPSADRLLRQVDTPAANNVADPNGLRAAARSQDQAAAAANANSGLGLGIDEQIKIRKPRAPIAKLDEDRLLAQNGIPKLRRICKERLRFKGKGHEFSDVARMLTTYQLWLDDMFPKATFADGLALIERVGHRKRMQVYRRGWIDEDKPKPSYDQDDSDSDAIQQEEDADFVPRGEGGEGNADTVADGIRVENTETTPPSNTERVENADDDDLYAVPSPEATSAGHHGTERVATGTSSGEAADLEMDDLDAMLAEEEALTNVAAHAKPTTQMQHDEFSEDEAAMAMMDNDW